MLNLTNFAGLVNMHPTTMVLLIGGFLTALYWTYILHDVIPPKGEEEEGS